MAEDLLHDAFVIILTSLDKLEDPEKIESWMTAIVRNVGYHYRQHLNKEQSALQRLAQERPETAETSLTPDYDELQSLVSQLPQGYQQVFRLSVFEGLSHQEISQLLGIAPHSSSSQLAHAKRMLRALIRQSWVLFLLLIAIPTAVWKLLQKEEPTEQPATARKTSSEPQQPKPVVERPNDKPVYAAAGKRPSSSPVNYQTEAVIQPDSTPYHAIEEKTDTLTETAQEEESPRDTLIYQPLPTLPPIDEYHLTVTTKSEPSGKWDIKLAYNGQIGQRDDYLAATSIGNGSFDAATNSQIPTEDAYDNWFVYNYYLSNSPYVSDDPETRSLINIATQNSAVNGGKMEAQYEYQLPITIQVLLSRQLSKRLSFETGLSYTRLSSTIKTGSSQAYFQERLRLHYLGIYLEPSLQYFVDDGSDIKTYRTEHPLSITLPLGIRFRW